MVPMVPIWFNRKPELRSPSGLDSKQNVLHSYYNPVSEALFPAQDLLFTKSPHHKVLIRGGIAPCKMAQVNGKREHFSQAR